MFTVRCYVCNIGIKACFTRFVGFLYIGWYNLSFWQTKCLKTAKNRFFKIGGQSMLWGVGVWCVPEIVESGTGDGRGMCVCLVRHPCITCMEVFSFRFCEKRFLPFSVVAFIIFYKCGIWVFLGCQACFMCFGGVLYWLWRDMCL